MRVQSVNIGGVRDITVKTRRMQTGIYKEPVDHRVAIDRLGLRGDVRVETRKMGEQHHAVHVYPIEHYAHWAQVLGREPFPMGQFGENLTVSGLLEHEVRIGDVLRFGSAVLQIAQPRIPCGKLNQRMGLRFAPMFLASRRTGYYLRVLQEGDVGPGDAIELLERDQDSPTIEEFVRVSQDEYWDAIALRKLLRARDLMDAWKQTLESKLARAEAATGWHGLRELQVVRREPDDDDIVSLYLRCAKGRPLPAFRGGQRIVVVLGDRNSEQRRRLYAISSSPADLASYRITVQRRAGPTPADPMGVVSSHLAGLDIGACVWCAEPNGRLVVDRLDGERVPVLISKGIGIAPMVSIVHELRARGAASVCMLHQAGDTELPSLWRELVRIASDWPALRLVRFGEAPPSHQPAGGVEHRPGPCDAPQIVRCVPPDRGDFYIAGHRDFVTQCADDLRARGVPDDALHEESIG